MLRILKAVTFDIHERRHNKALHWTGIPLRSIPASEPERYAANKIKMGE
jgi:hypothetical protein